MYFFWCNMWATYILCTYKVVNVCLPPHMVVHIPPPCSTSRKPLILKGFLLDLNPVLMYIINISGAKWSDLE